MGKKKPTAKNEIDKYLQLTKDAQAKYGNKTIIFYQVGSFYEVYVCKTQLQKIGRAHV